MCGSPGVAVVLRRRLTPVQVRHDRAGNSFRWRITATPLLSGIVAGGTGAGTAGKAGVP